MQRSLLVCLQSFYRGAVTLTCLLGLFFLVTVGGAKAAPAHKDSHQPSFDKREQSRPPKTKLSPERQKGAERLKARLPDVQIDVDPLQGSPKFVRSSRRFLTGPDGEGAGVSPETAAKVAKNDKHRAVKTFLKEYEDLFGHKPELLDKAKVKRDCSSGHNGMRTVIWEQELDELPVFEANVRANLSAKGELVNIGSHFLADLEAAAAQPAANRDALIAKPPIPAGKAVALAAQSVGETLQETEVSALDQPSGKIKHQSFKAAGVNRSTAYLLWFPLDENSLRLCWQVILTSRAQGQMFRVLVDAQSGEVLLQDSLTSHLSTATYNVFTSDSPSPFSPGHPTLSTNQPPLVSRTLVTIDAVSTNASPLGWIPDGGNTTFGNNVDAHLDVNNDDLPDPGSRPVGSPSRVFNFTLNLSQQPSNYAPASVVQLFYWNNWMHDKLYDLGFTEAAGNFQATNFNRGGIEGDAVQADCQDAYAQAPAANNRNNANFSTPPEPPDPRYPTWQPRMQMYIFPGPAPDRDGSFDAEMVLHEYAHGLSSRLVGGGVGIRSLQTKGMGEGWSDFYALSLLSEPGDDVDAEYPVMAYLSYQLAGLTDNYYYGIRRYPYSTDMSKNPLTFRDIDPGQASFHTGIYSSPIFTNSVADEVHAMGELWCVTLWDARASMIKKYGHAIGNKKMLQLVTDGMKLSPANPTYLAARDAILQADLLTEGGANHPILWAAFARRGMGASATSPASTTTAGVAEAFDIPLSEVAVSVTIPSHLSSVGSLAKISGTVSDPTGAGILNNQVVFTLYQNGDFWTGSRWKANTSAQDPEVQLKAPVVNWQWNYTQVPSGSALRSGTYYVSAAVYDSNGSASVPRPGINSIQFNIDNSEPTVAITSPPNGAVISNLTVITGSAADAGEIETVRLYLYRYSDDKFWDSYSWGGGGSAILPTTYNPSTKTWRSTGNLPVMGGSNPDTSMPNGSYNIMAFAVDSAGNETRIDSVFTVDFHPIYTWTAGSWTDGDPSNNNNLWSNPANWNPYGVPTEEAHVIINDGDPTSDYLGFVRLHHLTLRGGNLWAPGMEVKFLDVSGGRFAPTGSVQIADGGVFNWSGGQLEPGTFNNPASGMVNITGSSSKAIYNAVFNNSGTVLWTGGSIYGHRVTFNNGPTGVWDAQAPDTLNLFPNFGDGVRSFVNWGTFLKTAGANSYQQGFFTNYGTVDIRTGSHSLYDHLALQPGSTITGAGKVRMLNGCCGVNVEVPGTATVSGTLEMAESNTHLHGNGTLLLATGGTLQISDGWVGGGVSIAGTGTVLWIGPGGFEGNNLLGPGVTTLVTGSASKSMGSGAVLRNQGTIRWQGSGSIYNYGYYLENRAAITNLAGGVLDIKSDGTPFSYSYNRSFFYNLPGARVIKSGGSGITTLNSFELHNYGEISCASGTLRLEESLFLEHGSVLTGSGQLILDNGTATLNGSVALDGPTVVLNGGVLVGTSSNALITTSSTGVFDWTGGRIDGVLTLATNSQARISGNNSKTLGDGTVFINAGHLTWSGSGEIYNYAYYTTQRATLNNLGLFMITGNAGWTYSYNVPTLNNLPGGVFRKTSGGGETASQWIFNNHGTVEAQSGQLAFYSGGESSGTFVAGAGAVRFTGGSHTLLDGARLGGLGTHQVAGGTVNLNGTVTLGESGSANALEISSGTLAGNGRLAGASVLQWTGGTIGGDLEFGPALVMNVTGSQTKSLGSGAQLRNHGIVNWTGPGTIYAYGYYSTDRATFHNQSNAVFNVLGDGQLFTSSYNPSFFNNLPGARFIKAQGPGTALIDSFIFTNNGELRADAGTLEFGGALSLGPGTALNGPGTIRFNGDITATAPLPSTVRVELLAGSFRGQTDTNGAPLATYSGTGLFDWKGGTINGVLNLASNSVMNLSGTELKILGDGAILNNYGIINWSGPGRIYNYGYYQEQRANLNNRPGGRFNVTADGQLFEISYNASFFNNDAGATFSKVAGIGETYISNFIFSNRGEMSAAMGTLRFEGAVNLFPPSVLSATGGKFVNGSGAITHYGKLTLNGAVFEMNGGTWASDPNQPGTIFTSNGGLLDWAGGSIYGTLTVAPASQMFISGSATKALSEGAVLENNGTVTWSGAGNIDNYAYYATQRATINNNNGALWLVTGSGSLTHSYNTPTFNNKAGAVFRKTGGATPTTCSWNFHQDGALELETGSLTLNGACAFAGGSSLKTSLAGTTLYANYGILTLNQSATLNGSLSVVTRNGFAPAESNSFTVVSYVSRTGEFTMQPLPLLTSPLIQKWDVNYSPSALTLNVVRAHRIEAPAKMQSGNFQMTFNGPAANAAIFQASTNLLDWESLQTNSPFTGTFQFQDGQAPMHSNRFYRILLVP